MGMFTDWVDRVLEESWFRVQHKNKLRREEVDPPQLSLAASTASVDAPDLNRQKQFVIRQALNGTYIEVGVTKYNPTGPNEHRREVYLVRDGEALIDAISTVLVLTEK